MPLFCEYLLCRGSNSKLFVKQQYTKESFFSHNLHVVGNTGFNTFT